jgi:hypothetical protein
MDRASVIDLSKNKIDHGISASVLLIDLRPQPDPTIKCSQATTMNSTKACTTNYYSCSLLSYLPVKPIGPFLLLERQQDLGDILGSVSR